MKKCKKCGSSVEERTILPEAFGIELDSIVRVVICECGVLCVFNYKGVSYEETFFSLFEAYEAAEDFFYYFFYLTK